MAIILVPEKKARGTFTWVVYAALPLVLAAISLFVFLPYFQNTFPMVSDQGNTQEPDIAIHFSALNSDQIRNLEPFDSNLIQFNYLAKDKNGKQVSGHVLADSNIDAKKILEAQQLQIISIEEAVVGRGDPFVSPTQLPIINSKQ